MLDLLVYLVRNRDRVISKAELIDQVWPAKFVSEAALTRCVMELRKSIADGFDEDPVKTLHRRGYRFVAPVEVDVAEEPVAQPAPIVRRRSPRVIGISAAVAAVVLIAIAGSFLSRSRKVAAVPRVAILPIAAAPGDGELNLVAMSMADFLSTRLEQVPSLVVRSPEASAALSLETPSLGDFARRAGVSYVISGGIRRAPGGKAQLHLLLHHFDRRGRVEETPLGRFDVPLVQQSPDVQQFRAVRENVVHRVVNELLPALRLESDAGLAPADPQAYRLYLLARDRLSQGACDGEASVELLKRSIELDPNFAPAWETYALAEYGLASSCGEDADHYQVALQALNRARRLSPASAHAVALTATVNAELGRTHEAYKVLLDAPRSIAATPDIQFATAYVLSYSGHLREAGKRLESALEVDPSFLAVGGWTPNVYLYQRDYPRFLRWLPATNTPVFRYYRGYAAYASGNTTAARAALSEVFRLNPSDVFARLSNALLNIIDGRPAEAQEVLRQLVRQRTEVRSTDGEVTYKIAELYQLAGASDAALDQLNTAVNQGFFCASCIRTDPVWDAIRRRPEFASVMARAERRHKAFAEQFGVPE